MPIAYPKLAEVKSWSPSIEEAITKQWQSAELWRLKETKSIKNLYGIDTPPPYINTPIHMGHAVTYSFMDMFARYRRMKGFQVLFPLGLDRNGLPIEVAAEKKFDISPFKVGRDKFLEACEKLLASTSAESIDSFARLGISFTSYQEGDHLGAIYKTDAPEYRALTQSTFIDLYKKGLIYEDSRINNWDTKLQTTVADAEIDYKDVPSTFNHIAFKVKETGEKIIIATTRPELLCSCGMIIFNPKDERYIHLEGKTAIIPIYGIEVPIQEHPFAKIDKGSGLVMMCSAGDVTDIQFFREMGISTRIAITKEGRMNDYAGSLKGLKVKEARQKIIEELKKESLLVKQEQITHNTPVSERSGAEIEFIEMPEFYLKQLEFRDEIRKISQNIAFFPEESKLILDRWLDSIAIDWPISRRRFYATSVPLWHTPEGYIAVPSPGQYYQPWKESPPQDAEVFKEGKYIGKISQKEFKSMEWKGEERVLDTWFDSSISELYITRYKTDPAFSKKAFPISLRPQGKEIVRTWLYYTILRGYLEKKQACFKDVWIHNHITDASGRKMSKSVGNIIDPQEILREYGSEALRLWAATEGDLSKQDLSCSKEKIKGEIKTITKLLNITRFITQFKKPAKAKITPFDQLFIDSIEHITSLADEKYEHYDFYTPVLQLRKFLWDQFASHYLEVVKNRAYNENKSFSDEESASAKYALHIILERIILLLSPVIPQASALLASELTLSLDEFPKAKAGKTDLTLIDKIMEFNSLVWKAKKDQGISLREPIRGLEVPKDLLIFEKDLKACHNLSK